MNVKTVLATLAVAIAGGALAKWIGMPLPWLLGSQLAVCILAVANVKLFGEPPQWPEKSRFFFMPILGVMIGGAFTSELIASIPGWWPTALALFVFLIISHWIVFLLFRAIGGYDIPTAFYAAAPGGFVESVLFGAAAGGNPAIIAAQQFTRILVSVFIIPLLFAAVLGEAVGSAAGVQVGGPNQPVPGLVDILVLGLAAIIGGYGGRRLKMPAGIMAGPILVSALAHLGGLTSAQPPALLIDATQLFIGTALGVQFVKISPRDVLRAFALAALGVIVMLILDAGFALAIGPFTDETFPALILAFAPGGLAEMSLVALSLGLSVPFVTIHHVLRIGFALTAGPAQYRWIVRRLFPDAPPPRSD